MSQIKYLLDSNICIHLLRRNSQVADRIRQVGWTNCCISEMTVVELFYGAECSQQRDKNIEEVQDFVNSITVLPLASCIREFCSQKARLRREGTMIEDYDLFIGCAAVSNNCIMVTENTKHLSRIQNITIENWVARY